MAKENKTDPWSMDDMDAVLKGLKNNKFRDQNELANDIFKPDVAGEDLKQAILKPMNCIKSEQLYHKCLELCNITSIWKQKRSEEQVFIIQRHILSKCCPVNSRQTHIQQRV